MSYNYEETIFEDVKEAVGNYDLQSTDKESLREELNDLLWTDDAVTGNGSGSYTFCRVTAEEYLIGNENLVEEVLNEFGQEFDFDTWFNWVEENAEDEDEWEDYHAMSTGEKLILIRGAEHCDVSIRCYLLAGAIDQYLETLSIPEES